MAYVRAPTLEQVYLSQGSYVQNIAYIPGRGYVPATFVKFGQGYKILVDDDANKEKYEATPSVNAEGVNWTGTPGEGVM